MALPFFFLLLLLPFTCVGQIVFPGQAPLPAPTAGGVVGQAPRPAPSAGGVVGQAGPPALPHPPGRTGPRVPGPGEVHGPRGAQVPWGAQLPGVAQPPGGGASLLFPRVEELPQVPCTTAAGAGGLCRVLVQCATFFAELAELSRSPCTIRGDQQGVCCPVVQFPTQDTSSIVSSPPRPGVTPPNIEPKQINFAVEQSQAQAQEKKAFERELVFNNIVAQSGSPVFLHARLFETNAIVFDLSQKANLALGATINMVQQFELSKEEAEFGLSTFSVSNTIIADTCPPEPECGDTKYRTVDGSCNNRKNKGWGQAATAFQRIVPADYSDGTSAPRLSRTGAPLPSPRLLSTRMTIPREDVYREFTLLIMQWGQFVDHDITHTPISKGDNFADISCCSEGEVRPPQELHPECLPIEVPGDDPFFAQFGQRCMEFTRSMPAIRKACSFGPREQMNQITGYMDASQVYGSTEPVAASLREGRNGRLQATQRVGRELLPEDDQALGCGGRRPACFMAGDGRLNEQPDLVVLHTVWLRQHNRVVDELARLNPGWSDELLYQEGKRIVAAQIQHVTYNEYLPIVLGQRFMVSFGLVPLSSGYANTYRETVDASITNAFAAAAFRYGHTLVTGRMRGYSKFGTVERDMTLSSTQFAPFFLYEAGSLDAMLRGLVVQPSEKFDNKFTPEVTNRLFAQNGSFGLDLVALNIQRGRDHGLPSYTKWRQACHLPAAATFDDLAQVMSSEVAAHLSSLYQHVDDVDLFIGGILEKPNPGSLLGPTFLCIVGDQFARLKLGDRFFYENGGLANSLTEGQLDQIRRTSLARIICDNSDDIDTMQPLAFVQAGVANRRVPCSDEALIPKVSLEPWRNEPVWV